EFTREAFLRGEVTPAFFGSALTNFGVEPFFDAFVELAPPPSARMIDLPDGREEPLDAADAPFSGYVAYPGDIVGLINRDTFRIGDTLSLKGGFEHKPLPMFQPEVFARLVPKELTKRKSFDKGLEQLISEGTVQMLMPESGVKEPIVAAVGKLQF